jgi:3-hydroxyisobutyrate dehydrogenase-like beta-hydroxyacid dehydrogenase
MATTIGLLHPGDMGGVVGACARTAGQRVLWASAGRSAGTRQRAAAAGLEDAGTVAALVAASDVVLSICPPHAALDLAREVAALRFAGLFVDGNAVAPATAREIGAIVARGGATFVDGGLIGPPPRVAGSTRLYLSGREAKRMVALFEGSALEALAVNDVPGAASALKMAYAAFTKGTSALLMGVRALAASEGVDEALLAEW